jgi:hypothetical protein
MTTVMIHAGAARVRLQLTDAMRQLAQIIPSGSDPLRTLRAHKPDVLLIAVRRRDRGASLSLAQRLKTDGRSPPLLGLIDPRCVLSDPIAACTRAQADGCLQGELSTERLAALLQGLRQPEPCVIGTLRY